MNRLPGIGTVLERAGLVQEQRTLTILPTETGGGIRNDRLTRRELDGALRRTLKLRCQVANDLIVAGIATTRASGQHNGCR
jgi:hypothetical protein